MSKRRVTIKDIAAEVGVSAITVSKALNGMPQVSDIMRAKIIETARAMDYKPNISARYLAKKELTIAFVYPEEPHEFYSFLKNGVKKAEEELADYKCGVEYYPYKRTLAADSADEVRESLERVLKRGADGVMLIGDYDYGAYTAVLKEITGAGIPVFYNTITGERLPGVIGEISLNARLDGMIAADFHGISKTMLGAGKPFKTAILAGTDKVSAHIDCINGYIEGAKRYGIEVVGVYGTEENPEIAYSLTGDIIKRYPDIRGMYISSYNSVGVCRWLKEHDMRDRVVTIGHDLYPELNVMIEDGFLKATLFQDQFEYGRRGLKTLFEYISGARTIDKCTKQMTPTLVTSSMLPFFPKYSSYSV